jgi:heptosyltransferase I
MEKGTSFLIISTNAIGDTYLSLSAITVIKDTFPDSKIYLLLNKESHLFIPFISVDEVFILKSKSIFSVIYKIWLIRKIYFDYSLTFFPGRINSILLFFSKAEAKAGFRNFRKIENWYNKTQKVYTNFVVKKVKTWNPEFNFLDRIKIVLETIGINCENVRKYNFEKIQLINQKSKSILIHPVSKISNKSISDVQLFSLIDYLRERYKYELIIIGGEELNPTSELFHNLSLKLVSIRNEESLSNILGLINNSILFIAVDSFPIHIADLLNSNFLGIFGPTNPKSVLVNSGKSIHFKKENLQYISNNKFIQAIDYYLANSDYV